MPRWLQIVLSIVLFAAAMLVVRAVLHATVPGFVVWLNDQAGEAAAAALIFGAIMAAGAYGFWPRYPDGTAKPLLPRRR